MSTSYINVIAFQRRDATYQYLILQFLEIYIGIVPYFIWVDQHIVINMHLSCR